MYTNNEIQQRKIKEKAKIPVYKGITLIVIFALAIFDTILMISIALIMGSVGTEMVRKESEKLIQQTGDNVVTSVYANLKKYEALASDMANVAEKLTLDEKLFKNVYPNFLDFDGDFDVAGGGIWHEPFKFNPEIARYSFFWGRNEENKFVFYNDYNTVGELPPDVYDEKRYNADPDYKNKFEEAPGYHNEEWYVVVEHLKEGHGFWSKSYMDPYSYQPMVTVTVALRDKEHNFTGVSTVDLKLEGLHKYFMEWRNKTGGYIFVTDRNNKFLTIAVEDDVDQRKLKEIAKKFQKDKQGNTSEEFIDINELAKKEPKFRPIASELHSLELEILKEAETMPAFDPNLGEIIDRASRQITSKEAVFIAAAIADPLADRIKDTRLIKKFEVENDFYLNEPVVVSVFHIPGAYWNVVVVKPDREYTEVAVEIRNTLILYIGIIVLFIFTMAITFQLFFVVKPIKRITEQMAGIEHELKTGREMEEIPRIELRKGTAVEIGTLAKAFNAMIDELKKAQANVVEKEKIQKEMELAAHIQTAILPNILDTEKHSVDAVMIPAVEVGGDYYDILTDKFGNKWYGIGDVSGHGLTSGLIMMMTQSIISTLVQVNPTMPLKDILSEYNKVMYNIINDRMEVSLFVTLSLIKTLGNGKFLIAGSHDDLFIYRKETKQCDRIATGGFWFGIEPDISQSLNVREFELKPGDIMVLYTDGVTEAMDKNREIWNDERFQKSILKHADKSITGMLKAILADINEYMDTQFDDISIVLVKCV